MKRIFTPANHIEGSGDFIVGSANCADPVVTAATTEHERDREGQTGVSSWVRLATLRIDRAHGPALSFYKAEAPTAVY